MASHALSLQDLIRQSQAKKAAAQAEAAKALEEHLEDLNNEEQHDNENNPQQLNNEGFPLVIELGTTENEIRQESETDKGLINKNEANEANRIVEIVDENVTTEKKKKRRRFEEVDEVTLLRRKKSKWASEHSKILFPPVIGYLPAGLSDTQMESFILRVRLEDINRRFINPFYGFDPSDERSPSPEPTYDSTGKRTNTRDLRLRANIAKERKNLVEKAMATCPSFRTPSDFGTVKKRLETKLRIPTEKFPDYNFFGLIIGPRGNTQKRLEKETGCKIVIRGIGASKEGKKNLTGRPMPGEDEPLHVLVSAENEECLNKGVEELAKLLTPSEGDDNSDHKKKQLMELAAINGTLREGECCAFCGGVGHRNWQCPERQGVPWKPIDIICGWCGDRSHPTSDCPKKGVGAPPPLVNLPPVLSSLTSNSNNQNESVDMDDVFESFMTELNSTEVDPEQNQNQTQNQTQNQNQTQTQTSVPIQINQNGVNPQISPIGRGQIQNHFQMGMGMGMGMGRGYQMNPFPLTPMPTAPLPPGGRGMGRGVQFPFPNPNIPSPHLYYPQQSSQPYTENTQNSFSQFGGQQQQQQQQQQTQHPLFQQQQQQNQQHPLMQSQHPLFQQQPGQQQQQQYHPLIQQQLNQQQQQQQQPSHFIPSQFQYNYPIPQMQPTQYYLPNNQPLPPPPLPTQDPDFIDSLPPLPPGPPLPESSLSSELSSPPPPPPPSP